jgi:metal-responsive CopG/Arc/MetJ family transcriptional regulator
MANRTGSMLSLQLPDDLNARIDDYRFEQRLASRSAAIRELIERGLAPAAKRKPKVAGDAA